MHVKYGASVFLVKYQVGADFLNPLLFSTLEGTPEYLEKCQKGPSPEIVL